MNFHEENDNLNVDSPALSVPSLSATSYFSSPESSPDDEPKDLSTRRTLFTMGNEDSPPRKLFVESANVLIDDEIGIADATSITSSETTAVASCNLSRKDATESNVEVPLNYFPVLSTSSSLASDERIHPLSEHPTDLVVDKTKSNFIENVADDENDQYQANQREQPSFMMEEPPEKTISCNSALNLTPVQLAEMFVSLGQTARQRYQDYGQAKTSSETPSLVKTVGCTSGKPLKESPPHMMKSVLLSESSSASDKKNNSSNGEIPRVQSLRRECITLKKEIKQDTSTNLSLRRAVHTQKQLNSSKVVEIMDKQTGLQTLEEKIKGLQKERDDQIERETELVETISILKEELDKLTLSSALSFDRIENERFETELKSESSRMEEQQNRVVEFESVLEKEEMTKFGLQTVINRLNNCRYRNEPIDEHGRQQGDTGEGLDDNEDIILNPFSTTNMFSIKVLSTLNNILERLEAIEIEKAEKACVFTEQLDKNNEEMRRFRRALKPEPGHTRTRVNISEDPKAIEVITFKDKKEIGAALENRSTWCCDWNMISN
mmetsp:Transcript_35732/g.38713  ORF Transcript_35732/g.38713 Transcript_35732/m.38713 type:complete len:551 (+) Transcript_35732:151-1803(+)